jgi:glutamate dehydrogenase (NADP+)
MDFAQYGDSGVRFQEALGHVAVSENFRRELIVPKRVVMVSLPLRRDSGAVEFFPAWRVWYNNRRGPIKGGVRFHPSVNAADLTTLGFRLTVKCAVAGLPYGGGAGGVAVKPDELSKAELERLSCEYVGAFASHLGPDMDILSPDLNTNATTMMWMQDHLQKITGRSAMTAFTGKSLGRGGSRGRAEATGQGALQVLAKVAAKHGRNIAGTRIAVQGFGSAGGQLALAAFHAGMRVVGVCDSTSAVVAEAGLDVPRLWQLKQSGVSFAGLARIGHDLPADWCLRSAEALLTLDTDVLAPSALGGWITRENASTVEARFILEVANGPITPEGANILAGRDRIIIPDVIANAGGVVGSYLEWVQNLRGESWSAGTVAHELQTRMGTLADTMLETAESERVSLGVAAYLMGVRQLAAAIE